jgi:carbon monoxide dehydrogenase subunit G
MIRIDEAIELDATAERAFEVVTRIEGYPAWLPGVVRATSLGGGEDGPTGGTGPRVGESFRLVSAGPGGIAVEATGRVEAVDPPRSITISAASSFFALRATCLVEALDGGRARVAVTAEIQPRGLAMFAAGRIEQELRAAAPLALARLETEARG